MRLAPIFAVALLVAASLPAQAAPMYALPDAVRINIAAAGTSYAIIGSTGTLIAAMPDGRVLYEGIDRVVARTEVRRLADVEGPEIPRGSAAADLEERQNRAALLREARLLERLGERPLVTVPFEVSALSGDSDDLGRPLVSGARIQPLRFQAEDGLLTFNGRLYRGTFELLEQSGRILVINTVNTEQYLMSVLGAEVPTSWHPQALAAQAIAARTYLSKRIGSRGAFDLHGDERDQAYYGLRGETDSTERAVRATSGIVATYRGVPIEAFYSANTGGHTENSENVWVTPLPYLRGVPSPWDAVALDSSWGASSYEWTKEYTEPALRRQLERLGVRVGNIRSIDVLERSAAERAMRVRVNGTLGSRDVLKDSTRGFFGLRSQLFWVDFIQTYEQEMVDFRDTGYEAERLRDERLAQLEGLGAERLAQFVGASAATTADGGVVLTGLRTSAHLYELPPRIVFTGRGWGHSVGMSQWGMQGMALEGHSFEQILKHYYQGIELTHVGGA